MPIFAATLVAALAGLSWIFGGGTPGLVTLALYAIGVSAGLPLGFVLFGRGAAAWAAGALIGYGLLAFAFWVPVALGQPGPLAFALAWLVLALGVWAFARASRGRPPLIPLPQWTSRDSGALLLVLHLVPLIVGAPFARAGERDAAGGRSYRAYFTADFIWHMALTNEVARFAPDLQNPYVAGEDLHYYWTYFLPAAVFGTRGEAGALTHVEGALKIGAMMTALLLLAMIYVLAWAATGRRWAAIAAAGLALLAPSFEGLYVIHDLAQRGRPLDALRDINIDAVSAWPQYAFRGFRIDGLIRSMWWTPQHAASCALGLIGVLAVSRGSLATIRAIVLTGIALGLSVAFNPFLGAVFCLIYGLTVLWDAASKELPLARAALHALAAVPAALALAWCVGAGMSEGAGALSFGLHRYAQTAPFQALFISLGGVLIPAVVGLMPSRHVPFRPVVPAAAALITALLLMHFVTITDAAWVGFRAGNVILVTVAMLVARGLVVTYYRSGRFLAITFALVLLATGLPTSAVDWYNARDLENKRMGPGFLWTVPFPADQQSGFDWVRRATPADAVVQFDPVVRGRQNWSGIPSFTGRRMAAGLPISLLPNPRHQELSNRVHAIFTTLPPDQAHAEARAMGIDYLWIDSDDRLARGGAAVDRLTARPDLFTPVFAEGDTRVLAIAR